MTETPQGRKTRDRYRIPLCANISETTPARELVYNGGRRKDLTCLTNKQQ